MDELKKYFITSQNSEYHEGRINVFLQEFNLEKKLKKAMLYMTALGIYEAEINGSKIGQQMFAPGFTYYYRHLLYQEHDVTVLLQQENHLKVYLGQGWYAGRFTHENLTEIYGSKTAVSWILSLEFEDGSKENIVSNANVQELTSKYQYAGFYDGEIYDETLTERAIGVTEKYNGKLPEIIAKTEIEVQIQENIPVSQVIKKAGKTIIDFGQNFAGIIEINPAYLSEKTTLKIRHGERLTDDGELYTDNLRKAKAEINYTGDSDSPLYRPRFSYMGFRYIELTGVDYVTGLITAHAVYSDMKRTGFFTSENAKIKRLFDNQVWGQKSNYVEVPTDCPQRDERQGYTGDGQVFALTGSYNYDTEIFWKKFLDDMHYSQLDNSEGYIGATIPANGPTEIGFLSMLGWGNAITIIPKMLFEHYGTDLYVKKHYSDMKKFVNAELSRLGDDHLWLEVNLGDWLMQGKDITWMAMHHGPVSNSFIINDLKIMIDLAKRFNLPEDEQTYRNSLKEVNDAYQQVFIQNDGTMLGDYQGAYIMALTYVLEDSDPLYTKVAAKFIENVEANGLQTGFFSTEFALPLLVKLGKEKLAYDLLLSEEYATWLYQVNNGATTIWERWDAIKEDGSVNDEVTSMQSDNMVSFNHYAFGSIGRFYYQYILGIQASKPGFTKIILKPYVDKRLKKVAGKYCSRVGKITSSWAFQDENVHFEFETPVEAVIVLPDGNRYEVEAGAYTYEVKQDSIIK